MLFEYGFHLFIIERFSVHLIYSFAYRVCNVVVCEVGRHSDYLRLIFPVYSHFLAEELSNVVSCFDPCHDGHVEIGQDQPVRVPLQVPFPQLGDCLLPGDAELHLWHVYVLSLQQNLYGVLAELLVVYYKDFVGVLSFRLNCYLVDRIDFVIVRVHWHWWYLLEDDWIVSLCFRIVSLWMFGACNLLLLKHSLILLID